ncbi:MAG: Gfo/Idh/MocA family oxidoreductase [Verrucomicrobiales bacterium]|nr:Gfo/Idh/MocA family oxidoreductase [Verrucomicrobiales bacterium]MCP5525389.1 Gfo/Idh/MocA family oxidoreductase [Verrucomicrobiales bacterium]
MSRVWRIAGINFDHMHMGDLLRMAHEHPHAEIVGICDEQPERMAWSVEQFQLPPERVFTDFRACLEAAAPDLVILCPATAQHADWTERIAPFGAHILVEKPFAANLRDADRMIRAVARAGRQLIINWPLRWVASHVTAKRMLEEGLIGELREVHYYDGNRGPLYHTADKIEREPGPEDKVASWWYRREHGGGSLLDYLGYGVTLGTWFHGGRQPIEVTTVVDQPAGLEVDEHSITVARYDCGLSKFETRWGTFTDPWTHQPQPKCGFVLRGADGTISSYDYEPVVRVQTRRHPEPTDHPVDALHPPFQNPVQYTLHCLAEGVPVGGPLSPATSRIGQQIVDAAVRSAGERRTVRLLA